MTTIVKIKVAIVLALGVLGYGILGWRFFEPTEPGGAISFVADGINWSSVGMGILLAVLLSGIGTLIGRSQGEHIGPLAVPAGLATLAIRSGGMERLLIEHVEGARVTMFYGMMAEVLFWGFLVAVGFIVAWAIRVMSMASSKDSDDASGANPQKSDKTGSGKGKSHLPVRHSGGFRKRHTSSLLLSGLMASGFCVVVTLLLLLILVQSDTEPLGAAGNIQVGGPASVKQIVLAVGLAFFLGALASHQLFEVRLGWFLLCPVLVSFLAYSLGVYKSVLPVTDVPVAPQFIPKSILFATILPVQYVGVGVLAIVIGYWYSFEMRYRHRARHISS